MVNSATATSVGQVTAIKGKKSAHCAYVYQFVHLREVESLCLEESEHDGD